MAVLCSAANGNFTSAGTWGLVDSTGFAGGENTFIALNTSYATARSVAFTPGAITIDAIGIKLAARLATGGQMSVAVVANGTTTPIAGCEVTIDCADLSPAIFADASGGWVLFKLAAPVTLSAATQYQVAAKLSATGSPSIQVWRHDATSANVSKFLRTTTTQAPVAGDDFFVLGELTGQGTGNDITVTMDSTAATDYGSGPSAANSVLQPCCVGKRGILDYGSSGSTNYVLRLSQTLTVYLGGTLNIGTTGTPIPRTSTAVLEFDQLSADGDYGLRIWGTCNIQGLSRTSGKNEVFCLLNTDEAVNSTSLGVDRDTGWLDNDVIVVASTTKTVAQSEAGTLNGGAGASSLTVDGFAGAGGGLAFAHSGVSPFQAEVILLTRNVMIRSTSSTLMSYVFASSNGVCDFDWAEFYYLGENVAAKRGIEISTTTLGSFNMQYCSVHDCEDFGLMSASATMANVTISNNVCRNLAQAAGPGISFTGVSAPATNVFEYNILIGTLSGGGISLGTSGAAFNTVNYNRVASCNAGTAMTLSGGTLAAPYIGNVAHSSAGNGFAGAQNAGTVGQDFVSWNNAGFGYIGSGGNNPSAMINLTAVGNTSGGWNLSGGNNHYIKNPLFAGLSSGIVGGPFTQAKGIEMSTFGSAGQIYIEDGSMGVASGVYTAHVGADIGATGSQNVNIEIFAHNLSLGSTTNVESGPTMFMSSGGTGLSGVSPWLNKNFVSIQKLNGTTGNNKTWLAGGNLTMDAVIYQTAAPSLRMTPNATAVKMQSAPTYRGILVPVKSGQPVTVSVAVRRSVVGDGAAYNGAQPRLLHRWNHALGFPYGTGTAAVIVLDTATVAAGNWETLTGTTGTPSEDGVLEFFVDCDGTTGWVNVDDWSVTDSGLQGDEKHWYNGLPFQGLITPTGGGSAGIIVNPGMNGGLQ
jgi:hypothetical protein